jgi:hypothetical protein
VVHALVAHVGVCGNTLTKRWVARSGDGLDTSNEVDIITLGDIERKPSKLSWADMDSGIEREETRLRVFVVWKGVVSLMGDCGTNSI